MMKKSLFIFLLFMSGCSWSPPGPFEQAVEQIVEQEILEKTGVKIDLTGIADEKSK